MELTKQEETRLIIFGHKVWKLLTNEERELYYNIDGTLSFVDRLFDMLHLNDRTVTVKQIDHIHNKICWRKN